MPDLIARAIQLIKDEPFLSYKDVEDELGLTAGSLTELLSSVQNLKPEYFHYMPLARGKRPCPDCGGPLRKRTSERTHLLLSEVFYQCCFEGCGSTFKGREELYERLTICRRPNPAIRLPLAASRQPKRYSAKNAHAAQSTT